MFDRAPQDNNIRRVMDACLPDLENKPDFERNVLRQVRGEVKVKKKLSVGLVFVIVLVLVVATALAVVTLRDTAQLIAQTEQESGFFSSWPPDKKVEVVTALAEQGYIKKTDGLQHMIDGKLAQDEASLIADEAISEFVGRDANEIGFLTIMQAAWGPFDQWTREEQAWYSKLMENVGVETEGKTFYVEPAGSIVEQQAVAIARSAIAKDFGVDESALNSYSCTVSFQIPEAAEPDDDQPYWYVAYSAPEDLPQESRLFNDLELYIHPETGELLQSVEDIRATIANAPKRPANELYQAIDAYYARAEEGGYYAFRDWPLELRAEYSQDITPKVKDILASGDLTDLMNCGSPDIAVIAQSTYVYGLPQENAIAQEKALASAKTALVGKYGLSPELFEKYRSINVYYDVTDDNVPLWKFFFNPKSLNIQEMENGYENPLLNLCYKVEINAYTGEVTYIEEFSFHLLGHELEYELKWY